MFTEESGPFSGLDVLGNGNVAVIEYLDENSSMIMVEPYSKFDSDGTIYSFSLMSWRKK